MPEHKKRVLFLCTGNSCRSQMAEGWLRHLGGERYEALSAGAAPAGYVHPLAVEVMKEVGIDISAQRSKSIAEFLPPHGQPPDLVVSVCSAAAQDCPTLPLRTERIDLPFDDPAQAEGSVEQKRRVFRRVRDQIKRTIRERFLTEQADG